MALDCLTDYIGLEACSPGTTPPSGLYINSLEGIELEMIDKIANEQQSDYAGVWADVQLRAIRQFRHDVRQALGARYRLRSVTQSVNIQKLIDTGTTTGASNQLRGFTLELLGASAQYLRSNLMQLNINQLFIYSDYAGSVPIYVYDLETGEQLDDLTSTLVVGWNTINVYQTYDTRRAFVCYNATNINSVSQDITQLKQAVNFSCFQGCESIWYDCSEICGFKINGATATPGSETSATKGLNTYGLSGTFNAVCSFDNLICQNLKTFETAFWYCLGVELMNERINTSRLNEWTVYDRNRARELRQLYMVKYKGGTMDEIAVDGFLPQAVEGINLNSADCCLECNAAINFVDARL